jgi:alpha-tubulin suppressor-like RCC1 family protein
MRTLVAPRSSFAGGLALVLSLLLVSCSDNGGGVTDPGPGPGPQPTLALTLGSASVGVTQGQANTVAVTITRGGGFDGPVSLSLEGAPSGVTGTFDPASIPSGSTASTLTLAASTASGVGSSSLTVRASGQGVGAQTASLALTVDPAPGFTLTIDPDWLDIPQGQSGTAEIQITRTQFTAAIALSVSGMPSGITASVSPASVTGDVATLTVDVGANADPGDHTVTVTGQADGVDDHTVGLELIVEQVVPAGDWVHATTGQHHTCALNQDGEAYCWGRNHAGQLGDGTTTQRMRPSLVAGGHLWASVTAGWDHSCGITTTGEGFCWGDGSWGQLGNGSTASSPAPEPIAVTAGDTWATLSAGQHHTCGLTPDGRAFCWGRGRYGRNGDGTISNRSTRVLVAGDHTWQSIRAAIDHTCGLTTAGEAHCWGRRGLGRVGDGGATGNATIPALVQGGLTWTHVSARGDHSCGITTAGDGHCWGSNNRGQLGNGNTTNQSTPAPVLNNHQWAHLRPGWTNTTCGITESGEAFCWGYNAMGQVGDGTTGNKTAPQPVSGGHTWTTVSGGVEHACGITEAGEAFCWGRGSYGQLGNGSAASTNYPTPIKVLDPQ